MASNKTSSGASYEAVLIDKITEPIDDIIKSLDKLEEKFKEVSKPAKEVSDAMNTISKSSAKVGRNAASGSSGIKGIAEGMTRLRTVALSTGQAVSATLNSIATLFKAAGAAALGFSVAAVFAISKFLSASAAAEETQNKFAIAFGKSAAATDKWANSLSAAIGRSKVEIQDFSSTFQTLFTGYGFAEGEATQLSTAMTQLAYDIGSFNNVADDDAMQRLLSGLTGSTEAMERFGVNIKASAIDTWLMKKGIDATNESLDEQQKVLARAGLMIEATARQQGDAANTASSWTNQTKALWAALNTLQKALGDAFSRELLDPLRRAVDSIKQLANAAKNLDASAIRSYLGTLAAVAVAGAGLIATGIALTFLAGLVIAATTAFAALAAGVVAVISAITFLSGFVAVIPALTASIPVLLAAVAVGLIAIFAAANSARSMVDILGDAFSRMKEVAEVAFGILEAGYRGLTDAISKNQWTLAWEVAVETGKLAFMYLGLEIARILKDSIERGIKAGLSGGDPLSFGAPGSLEKAVANQAVKVGQLLAQVKEAEDLSSSESSGGLADILQAGKDVTERLRRQTEGAKIMEEIKAWSEELDKGWRAAVQYAKQFRTPMEVFNDSIEEARKHAEALNDPQLLARATAAAQKVLDAATKAPEVRAPDAFITTSVGAAASGYASGLGNFGPAMDPLVEEQKKQTEVLVENGKVLKNVDKKLKNSQTLVMQ